MDLHKKILIVEDEKSLLDILRDQLEVEGFSVSTASNGKEGLIATKIQKPDLILLDIVMPKMDGLTMIRKLRAIHDNTPVIMLTNLDSLEHISNAVSLGSFDYLIKSDWKLQDIVDRVKEKLALV